MNRTTKFVYNTIASAAYQIIILIVGLITPRIMLITYGSEINGLVSSITQFVVYFTIVEAGLSSAAVYSLYVPLAQNDHDGISGIVVAARNFYYKSGYIFLGLITILAIVYPMFVSVDSLRTPEVVILVFILGINNVIDFFLLSKYRALLTADQRSYVISLGSIINAIINLTLVVILAYMKTDVVLMKGIATISVLFRSAFLYVYCKKKYPYINYHAKPNNEALSKRWSAFYLQLLQVVQKGAPTILITFFSTLQNVSIYTIYNMVIAGISSVLDIFMSGLSASFGDIISRNDEKTLHKAYRDFEFAYYGLITIVYAVAFALIMPFVGLYTRGITDANYRQNILGILFICNAYLYNLKTPQGMLVISAGLYKETQTQSTIQALLIIIPGIILAPKFGLIGVLVALIISNGYRDIDLIFYIPREVTHLPIRETVGRIIRSFVCMIIVIATTFSIFQMSMDSYLQWGIYALAVCMYAVAIWIIINFLTDRKQLYSLVKRMTKIVVKRK